MAAEQPDFADLLIDLLREEFGLTLPEEPPVPSADLPALVPVKPPASDPTKA